MKQFSNSDLIRFRLLLQCLGEELDETPTAGNERLGEIVLYFLRKIDAHIAGFRPINPAIGQVLPTLKE